MFTKSYMTKKITRNLHPPTRTTVPKIRESQCKVSPEYVNEIFVEHHRSLKGLVYRVHWYVYTAEEYT